MQSKEEIQVDIGDFIVEQFLFGVESERPSVDQSLMGTGVVDSTSMLELVSKIEQMFTIEIKDEDFGPETLDTIERIAKYVLRVADERVGSKE